MNKSIGKVLPVLFGFFVMGFCDVVGISTSYVKADFGLSETLAGFIPSMVFLWFLLLSVPTAMAMNRLGRKTMVQISNVITIVGMLVPFVSYGFVSCMAAFALLGIGNTIIQVALNPLLASVVKGDALTSSLTAGQVVKAVSSFLGPFIAAFAVLAFGNWQYLFPIFAGITFLSALWLQVTPIDEGSAIGKASTFGETFALLKNRTILLLLLGIVFIVGTDVGMNTVAPKLLIERCGFAVQDAGYGSSVYFFCRTAGALIGSVLLARLSDIGYYRINILLAFAAMIGLFFMEGMVAILSLVGLIGFACSSIFPVLYSVALRTRPDKANEISGLMITGVFGGAVIPPLMGAAADAIGSQGGSLAVISGCIVYLIFCSRLLKSSR